jgi:ribonuclease inhibitor
MGFSLDIDGRVVRTEQAFHHAVMEASQFGYYGHNLDALWDVLTGIVDAPIQIRWSHAASSKAGMGERFAQIVQVIQDAEERYNSEWPSEIFKFELTD